MSFGPHYFTANKSAFLVNIVLCSTVVGVVTGLQSGRSRVRILERARDFCHLDHPDWRWGLTQLPIQWLLKFFLGIEQPECEVDHSAWYSAKGENDWSYTYYYYYYYYSTTTVRGSGLCTISFQDFLSLMSWIQFLTFSFLKSYTTSSLQLFFGSYSWGIPISDLN